MPRSLLLARPPRELAPEDTMHSAAAHAHISFTQEEKLPLHHAAAKGAPSEVMELLLDANREATTSRDKV